MMKNYQSTFNSSVTGVLDYMKKSGLKTLVLGISGGIDSTVCAAIGKEVVKRNPDINLVGVYLPSNSNTKEETEAALKVGNAFFIPGKFTEVSIQEKYELLKDWCCPVNKVSKGNIKARLRMIYLRNLAATYNGLLLDTDNLSEHYLGFFTIAGDVGDLSPIGELWKHEVFELATWIKDNCSDIEKEAISYSLALTPTDGNGVAEGGDLGQIAPSLTDYYQLDEILMTYLEYKKKPDEANLFEFQKISDKYGESTVSEVISRHKSSEFKRLPSPVRIKLDIDRPKPDMRKMYPRLKVEK